MAGIAAFLSQHADLLVTLLGAGALAGLLAGLFGLGGGIVIVPVLFNVLTESGFAADTALHVAMGTSLATIILTGLSSARAHVDKGAVDRQVLNWLVLPTALGAWAGAFVAGRVPGSWLVLLFASFAILVSALMMQGRKGFALVHQLPAPPGRQLLGFVIGLLSALLGIGGGTISVPTLAACGYAMTTAVGTGAALGLAIAVPGTIGYIVSGWGQSGLPPFSVGYVNLLAVAFMTPLTVALAPAGARLAHRLPDVWLRRGFALLLALIAVRMIWKALQS